MGNQCISRNQFNGIIDIEEDDYIEMPSVMDLEEATQIIESQRSLISDLKISIDCLKNQANNTKQEQMESPEIKPELPPKKIKIDPSKNYLCQMPVEVLLRILSFLDDKNLCKIAPLHQKLYRATNYECFYMRRILENGKLYFDHYLPKLSTLEINFDGFCLHAQKISSWKHAYALLNEPHRCCNCSKYYSYTYNTENACFYHSGKRVFLERPPYGPSGCRWSCCNEIDPTSHGCIKGGFHKTMSV